MTSLDDVLFVLSDFPEPTQTFIHRELEHMERAGGRVHLLAGRRLPCDRGSGIAGIAARALYLGSPASWAPRGLAWAARHPRRFAAAAAWAARLPHRTPAHRARMLAMLVAAASVADQVAAGRFRYLHAHFAAYQTELAMCLGRLLDLPYGVTLHAYDIYQDNNILREKLGGARVAFTCTRYNADTLREVAPDAAARIHQIYHGIDRALVPTEAAHSEGRAELIAIGRLVEKKGFEVLIDAAALLRAEGLDFHVSLIGDGPERPALAARIDRAGLSAHVTLVGAVANRDVWQRLRGARAIVAPSVRGADGNIDGIPNVVLEAMFAGVPAVASELSGIPEVVLPGRTGWLVPPGDAAALACAMREAIADPARAARHGAEARAFVTQHFDVAVNVATQLALMAEARG